MMPNKQVEPVYRFAQRFTGWAKLLDFERIACVSS
jgi:hypothetical protein